MSETRFNFSERICLILCSAIRELHFFKSPYDVNDLQNQEKIYASELLRSRSFKDHFSLPLNVTGKDILELGCKYGGLVTGMSQSGTSIGVGLDIDYTALVFAQKRNSEVSNLHFVLASAEDIPFDSASFDVVISDAVFEHVSNIGKLLEEVHRVLRPGGYLFAKFSPTWLTYNGPHLIKIIPIPWVHLFFSDRTILNVLSILKNQNKFPASYVEEKIMDFQRMGRLTRKKFRKASRQSGMKILQENSWSPRRLKMALSQLPILDELYAGQIVTILQK